MKDAIANNSTASISQARKAVEQLKMEACMDRIKKSRRGKGLAPVEAMEVDEEEQRTRLKQISPRHLRGPPIHKQSTAAEAMEVDEDEEEQQTRPKQIPAKYLRKPPISKPKEVDEDREQRRPKQIPAKYLRGPPIGARDPDSQATVRTPGSRPTRRREPTVQRHIENDFHREERSRRNCYREERAWRDRYWEEPAWRSCYDPNIAAKDGGPTDAREGQLLWCLCAGFAVLVALAALSI